MSLTIDEKKAIISYRIQKSETAMIEARDNALLNHWSLGSEPPVLCSISHGFSSNGG